MNLHELKRRCYALVILNYGSTRSKNALSFIHAFWYGVTSVKEIPFATTCLMSGRYQDLIEAQEELKT